MIGSHKHSKSVTGLSQLCAGSVAECESSLACQKAEDSAEVKHVEEEKQKIEMEKHMLEQEVEKQKIEMEKHMLEQEVEKQERMKEMEKQEIDGAGNSDLEDDAGSQSTLCKQMVCMEFLCQPVLIPFFIREHPRRSQSICLMRRYVPSCSK